MAEHNELDRFAIQSNLYNYDARVKLASTVSLVVVTAMIQSIPALLLLLGFALILVFSSKVPLHHIEEHFLLAAPFILFATITIFLTSGITNAMAMTLRMSASVLILIVLIATTPFFEMMAAFRWFKMPQLLANIILFTYRFIFVLRDESDRMKMARKARGFSGGRHLFEKRAFQTISNAIGMVFVRSNQRASNIFDALLTRGYSGKVRTLKVKNAGLKDVALALTFAIVCISSILIQYRLLQWIP